MRSNGEINRVRSRPVPGRKGPGRPKKTWDECVKQDLKVCGLSEAGTQDRVSWRSSVKNSRQEPTPFNGGAPQSMAAPPTRRVLGMRTRSYNKTGFDWLIDWYNLWKYVVNRRCSMSYKNRETFFTAYWTPNKLFRDARIRHTENMSDPMRKQQMLSIHKTTMPIILCHGIPHKLYVNTRYGVLLWYQSMMDVHPLNLRRCIKYRIIITFQETKLLEPPLKLPIHPIRTGYQYLKHIHSDSAFTSKYPDDTVNNFFASVFFLIQLPTHTRGRPDHSLDAHWVS